MLDQRLEAPTEPVGTTGDQMVWLQGILQGSLNEPIAKPEPEPSKRTVSLAIDSVGTKTREEKMSEPVSKDLLDAKLEAIEARMDGRIARIEDNTDRIVKTMDRMDVRMDRIEDTVSNQKYWFIGTGIAIVLGVAGIIANNNANNTAWMIDSIDRIEQAVGQHSHPPEQPKK